MPISKIDKIQVIQFLGGVFTLLSTITPQTELLLKMGGHRRFLNGYSI
jgi:hypothetical protein